MNFDPDMVILHCGTNDLKSTNCNEDLASNIIDLAKELSEKCHVCISALLPRNDRFKERISEVNQLLKYMCSERNLGFIEHDNINPSNHLNRSKLHPNKKGSELLAENLRLVLKE